MQELWSNDEGVIIEEVERLVSGQTPLTLYQKGFDPQKIVPQKILTKKTYKLILFNKNKPFQAPNDSCLFLYQTKNRPMRGFHSTPLLDKEKELGIAVPGSIIEIQRRKHPRYVASERSQVTFTRMGSQYINYGMIADICIEGARLVGNFSDHIKDGDYLSPMSMTLRLSIGQYEELVVAHEALVRRVVELGDGKKELGVHFMLKGPDVDKLETYLSIRAIEELPPNSAQKAK